NGLVETAYRQNPNVRVAGARIQEARAIRNIAAGNLFPQIQTATADYMRVNLSRNKATPTFVPYFDNWSAGLNLSWELDFWGRFRRAVEAADAEFDASVENYDDVLVILVSDVAANYIQIRTFQQRIKYVDDNIATQAE